MLRCISVRAVDSAGRPVRDTPITLEIHQFAAGGMKAEFTDSEGLAQFELDLDRFAEITIYANGNPKVRRGKIKTEYTVTV
ncbi:MAG TPA: hypothetical protein VFJ58_03990 [Armatimonadota bacterium]|nr:hypothetical protein [Armatimonadota bacterium]